MSINDKSLIIQNLDQKVTEQALEGIFALISPVTSCKIIPDSQNADLNKGYLEFHEHQGAEQALHAMDGRVIYSKKIKVNWSFEEESNENAQIFVKNMDSNVDDEILADAFKQFHMLTARVCKNGDLDESLFYGIVTFPSKEKAEEAIQKMNGQQILSQTIECTLELDDSDAKSLTFSNSTLVTLANMSYEEIFAQTPLYNTSVYIRNLPKEIIKQDIAPYLQQHGYVSDIHLEADKGTATVKLDTHANAATAIFALQGATIAGKTVQLGWVKDRTIQRNDSHDHLNRSFNVFSSGYIPPSKLVQQITKSYDNHHTTTRPPAPAFEPSGEDVHGWNQYYQQYYSAGHLTI
ncbi:hypothetical protein K501DRAFT_259618 [Backusella circina FSU 941]|nr:hypothetical protein K501DRAFT_259618 [Backusella circina FSU 941]